MVPQQLRERERLPRNFSEEFALKFYKIEKGSTAVPLVRPVPLGKLFLVHDELDDAVELVAETISCASSGKLLPSNFPKDVIPMFLQYGKTLRDDEYFEQKTFKDTVALYTTEARDELTARILSTYEDEVDVTGSVIGAKVTKNSKMSLLVSANSEIDANFDSSDELRILNALLKHETVKVRVRGRGIFSAEGYLQKLVSTRKIDVLGEGVDAQYPESVKPIWERFADVAAKIPEADRLAAPIDGSENLDKYLRGANGL